MSLFRGATGRSVIHDYGITWSYSLGVFGYYLFLILMCFGLRCVADFTPSCADCFYVESYIIDGWLFSIEFHYVVMLLRLGHRPVIDWPKGGWKVSTLFKL